MKEKLSLGLVAVACVAFLATGAMGQGNVFFAELGGGGPVLGDISYLETNDTGGLQIWSSDDQNFRTTISIDVASSTPGVISFTGAEVSQPEMISDALGGPAEIWRWQYTIEGDTIIDPTAGVAVGSVGPDAIIGMNGAAVTTGEGVNNELDGTVPLFKLRDPLFDQAADSIMLGTIDYDVIGEGTTTVTMSIGEKLFVDAGQEISPTMWSAEITVGTVGPIRGESEDFPLEGTMEGNVLTFEGVDMSNPPATVDGMDGAWFDPPLDRVNVAITDGVSTIAEVALPSLAAWPDTDGLYGVVDAPGNADAIVAAGGSQAFAPAVMEFGVNGIDPELGNVNDFPIFLSFETLGPDNMVSLQITAIPEPSTLVLVAFGLIAMIGYGLKR